MSLERHLRGGCGCGRNRYIIQFPQSGRDGARVVFDSRPSHRLFQASPLATFIRVPLSWVHSTTLPVFPDETSSMIHRVYTSPHEQHAMRHFCGFCGTPLSYWSEQPRSEADFIQLTLGSLSAEDLADLEDLGLLPSSDDEEDGKEEDGAAATTTTTAPTDLGSSPQRNDGGVAVHNKSGRETVGGLPWFDTLTAGSRLGNLRTAKGGSQSRDGTVRVEWEIIEWTEDDEGDHDTQKPGKRKLGDRDDTKELATHAGQTGGVQQ